VVLDGVARAPQVEMLRALAQEEGAQFLLVMTECSDLALHHPALMDADVTFPIGTNSDWSHVNRSRTSGIRICLST